MSRTISAERLLWSLLALLVALRLLSLGLYPLMDTTEARYGEIARKMVELGDWVTPWFDYGTPFWGKPPLAFWLSASGLSLFGINEFAARLPHLLAALLTGWVVWDLGRRRDRFAAQLALLLLAASSLFLVAAGAVMTDMVLALGVALALRAIWLMRAGAGGAHALTLGFGLAIGLLAKGPLALVLVGIPVALWAVTTGRLVALLRDWRWFVGLLLALALAAPWYWLAEHRTPGFLHYFLIGEHWQRFTVPGWQGDLYGNGHDFARGSIWLFALLALLPWPLLLPWLARRQRRPVAPDPQRWRRFLLLWGIAPCLLFTLAGNILWTYVLPGLPALALLAGDWLTRLADRRTAVRWVAAGSLCSALLFALFVAHLTLDGGAEQKSARTLVADYRLSAQRGEPLLFYRSRPYSAQFYNRGRTELVVDPQILAARIDWQPLFVAMNARDHAALPAPLRAELHPLAHHGRWRLYRAGPTLRLDAVSPAPLTSRSSS